MADCLFDEDSILCLIWNLSSGLTSLASLCIKVSTDSIGSQNSDNISGVGIQIDSLENSVGDAGGGTLFLSDGALKLFGLSLCLEEEMWISSLEIVTTSW